MTSPLTPEERADMRRWTVGTGSVRVANVARLLDERDALERERDALNACSAEGNAWGEREKRRADQAERERDEARAELQDRRDVIPAVALLANAMDKNGVPWESLSTGRLWPLVQAASQTLFETGRHRDARDRTIRILDEVAEAKNLLEAERDRLAARLEQAREALDRLLTCGPPGFRLGALLDTPQEKEAVAALRAALDPKEGP
jgi:hypothetical protein